MSLTVEVHDTSAGKAVGKYCELLRRERDHEVTRFHEAARILEELDNLRRHMLLVQFEDGATTFLFPPEVLIKDC
jgi:hypothetical protein